MISSCLKEICLRISFLFILLLLKSSHLFRCKEWFVDSLHCSCPDSCRIGCSWEINCFSGFWPLKWIISQDIESSFDFFFVSQMGNFVLLKEFLSFLFRQALLPCHSLNIIPNLESFLLIFLSKISFV